MYTYMNLLRKTARNKSGDILLRESVFLYIVFLFFSSSLFCLFVCFFFSLWNCQEAIFLKCVRGDSHAQISHKFIHVCETEET